MERRKTMKNETIGYIKDETTCKGASLTQEEEEEVTEWYRKQVE